MIYIEKKVVENYMIELGQVQIKFETGSGAPYFQVPSAQRIRFGMENLTTPIIKQLIDKLINDNQNIDVFFLVAYLRNGRPVSCKSEVGRFFKIKNWQETVIHDEEEESTFIYATVRNIDKQALKMYCSKVLIGYTSALINFYTEEFLIYVDTDVIDIISNHEDKISQLKEQYVDLYDRYYEED